MARTVLFWLHLAAGVSAGVVILIMSVTGALLTYERQIQEWTSAHLRSVPPSPDAQRMSIEALLAEALRLHPDLFISGVTVSARADGAVTILADPTPLYLDAYSGTALGQRRGGSIRASLGRLRAWHRWFAIEGDGRVLARAVTGWSNVFFLLIVASGIYLWIPRVLSWSAVRQVLFFRRRYGTGKARDFNWHHVIGIWSALPLFIIVLGAIPISFPAAGDLVYRIVGEQPPARIPPAAPTGGIEAQRGTRGAGRPTELRRVGGGTPDGAPAVRTVLAGLDVGFARAMADHSGWRTIAVRLPRGGDEALAFTIDDGNGGQPHLRSTLTITRAGAIAGRERFSDQSTGRQVRSILRFAHTGEALGRVGQTVAGLATVCAVVMVWTGFALSWRRLRGWRVRRGTVAVKPVSVSFR